MTQELSIGRRGILLGGSVLTASVAFPTPSHAAASPKVGARAATSTLCVVTVVGLKEGTKITCTTTQGEEVATLIRQGIALLKVPMSRSSSTTATLKSRSWSTSLRISTRPSALSGSTWRVVNRNNRLPSSYVPALTTIEGYRVSTAAASSYRKMQSASARAGVPMNLVSAYRSYSYQQDVYDRWVRKLGRAKADLVSARPGYSEHQLGLALDIRRPDSYCTLKQCFGTTSLAKWVAENAHTYGFIVRYPSGQTSTTGYSWEPWHLRYVRVSMANDMRRRGSKTLEDYLGLPAAKDYP